MIEQMESLKSAWSEKRSQASNYWSRSRAEVSSNVKGTSAYRWAQGAAQAASHSKRFATYAHAGKRGFLSSLGFEFVPRQGGLASTFEKGFKHTPGMVGSWRFGGIGQSAEQYLSAGKFKKVDPYAARPGGGRTRMYRAARAGLVEGVGPGRLSSLRHASKGVFSLGGPAMMLGLAGYSAYTGYQEGGLWGATKAVGTHAVEWAAFDVALTALGAAALPLEIGAAVAAAGYGGYKLADYSAKRHRRQRMLEFGGSPIEDQFGTINTMRQRSLMEMQRSHGAIRGALGTEAQYMHIV